MLWSPGSEAPNIVTLSRRLFHHKLWALYHTTCSASKGALQLSTLNRNLRSNHQIRVDRSRSNHGANSIGHSSRMKGLSFSELKHQMLTDIQYVWSTAMRKHVGPFYSFQCWLGSDSCWSNLRISSHRHLVWFVNIILIAPPSSHFHGIKHMLNHHRCNHLSWVAKSFGLPLLCEFPWRSWPLGHFLSLVVKLQTVNLGRDFHSNLIGKKWTRWSPRTRMLTRMLMVQMSKHMVMQSRTIPFCYSLFEQSCACFPCYQSAVWSGKCRVWSVKCGVGSVECVKCRMRSVKCRVWSMECKV